MSDQDYNPHHQGSFNFNGLESSHQEQQQPQQQHIAQQIRRDKLRMRSEFEVSQTPIVSLGGESTYQSSGVLSEMYNFHSSATELLENQISQSFRRIGSGGDWYGQRQQLGLGPLIVDDKHQERVINNNDTDSLSDAAHHHHHQQQQQISRINADSSTAVDAMQLFLLNPRENTTSSPSQTSIPPPETTSYMLPYQTSQFEQWGNQETTDEGFVERGSLSLSLSSSKAQELLRVGGGGSNAMLCFNQEGSGRSSSSNSTMHIGFKNLAAHNNQQQEFHFQNQYHHQSHHLGSTPVSSGMVNHLRNSRYSKAAQELLEEFCSVARGHPMMMKNKNKLTREDTINPSSNQGNNGNNDDHAPPPLSAADRIEHQRRKVKLLSMLDELDRRYTNYSEQMQMVVNSFEVIMGYGAAIPYTSLAQKAMSRHFRCLKDSITTQLKHSFEVLGEKDGSASSGLTKGETPRLKILEQSLRQQRTYNQMGMMEQEAWRPQRGLPDRSVNVLRAWLFEHFLHPYPSDADKQLLARQTGLSRNQVSNWFINARVRLWKPMVEEMYQQESKEETENNGEDANASAQHNMITTTTTTMTTTSSSLVDISTSRRSEPNEFENDHSSDAINNKQHFMGNQPKQQPLSNSFSATLSSSLTSHIPSTSITTTMPSLMQSFPVDYDPRGSILGTDFGVATTSDDIGSTLIKFGTSSRNVSLTLGLRHPGDLPENSSFSVRDFGSC
ncbi:homeodomain transcription factor [Lithospermum erythrorhizon]|uniref:Homeodomain transcription factor n=1 Tax=Lithospermum erythrorhizon TaxID=34254 RepID=A0AAV3NGL2_LITER